MFRVGQKVVCIRDYSEASVRVPVCPKEGDVLTVRGAMKSPPDDFPRPNTWGVVFEEIRPPGNAKGHDVEVHYLAEFFRPVQEKGMEMLRAILVHPKSPIKEDA